VNDRENREQQTELMTDTKKDHTYCAESITAERERYGGARLGQNTPEREGALQPQRNGTQPV